MGASQRREHASCRSESASSEPQGEDRSHALGGHGRDGGADYAETETDYEDEVEDHVRCSGEGHDGERAD